MGAVVQILHREPATLEDVVFALETIQSALITALPDAAAVTIELVPSGKEVPFFRARIELKHLVDPTETVFLLNRDLVPGYKFFSVGHSCSAGSRQSTVIAQIKVG